MVMVSVVMMVVMGVVVMVGWCGWVTGVVGGGRWVAVPPGYVWWALGMVIIALIALVCSSDPPSCPHRASPSPCLSSIHAWYSPYIQPTAPAGHHIAAPHRHGAPGSRGDPNDPPHPDRPRTVPYVGLDSMFSSISHALFRLFFSHAIPCSTPMHACPPRVYNPAPHAPPNHHYSVPVVRCPW